MLESLLPRDELERVSDGGRGAVIPGTMPTQILSGLLLEIFNVCIGAWMLRLP